MQDNPILSVFKIATFAILAFLVWISFVKGLRQEESTHELQRRIGTLQGEMAISQATNRELRDAVREQSAKVEALTGVLARGGFAPRGGGASAPVPVMAPADGVPDHLSEAAKALWGRWPDFLEPDPGRAPWPALDTEGVDPSGRLRVHYGPSPSSINPVTGGDADTTVKIDAYVMQSAAIPHDANLAKYAPELAIRVEHSPDYTEWVVWLRRGVRWHTPQVDLQRYPHLKGRHLVTAHDLAFTLDLILNPDVDAGRIRGYYEECEGIEVIDDHCYVMRWKKPQYTSIAYTLTLEPIPRFVFAYDETGKLYEKGERGLAFNDHWFYRDHHYLGCGPYYVAELDPDSHVLLRRFEDYFGEARPPIREIYQQIFPEDRLALKKLEKGEFDGLELQLKDWERVVKNATEPSAFTDGRLGENWYWRPQYNFIGWKNSHPIFQDLEVRRAMTQACNRARIRDVLYLGRAKIRTGPHNPNTPFCPPEIQPLPFDLKAAAAALGKAGWRDRDQDGVLEKTIDGVSTEFRFEAMLPNHPISRAVFQIFKEDLDKIGVKMSLEFLHWKQFIERLNARKFECTSLSWVGSGWESDLHQIWHSTRIDDVPSSNFIEFRDAKVDELIDRLRATFDPAERIRLQREVHRRIWSLQPYTFLITSEAPYLHWKNRLENVEAGLFDIRPNVRHQPMTLTAGR